MVGGVKDKIMILLKTNTTENFSKLTRVNNAFGSQKKQENQNKKNKIKRQHT